MRDLGKDVASSEATKGFKGKDSNNYVTKYESEVYGYIIYCIYGDGYIYTLF